ncbi:regulator component [Streptomyces sp. NPDC021224]|uniref:regulator component n=1 Tax=unclassified Streptomyces TaxID=2593676 RepID=UPI0037B917EC
MHDSQVRESHERHINRLGLPYRFTTRELCDAIAMQRGKPITVRPLDTRGKANVPCGVRVETPTGDLVFYEKSASVHHQRHILTHELMHVYMDHPGSLEVDTATARLIGVNPILVLRMSGRTSYSSEEEREAEMFASLVRHRMYREREAPARDPARGSESWEALFAQPSMRSRRRCL